MNKYQVKYITKEWVSVDVLAENETEAIEKADKLLHNDNHKNKMIEVIDWQLKYEGIDNLTVLDEMEL